MHNDGAVKNNNNKNNNNDPPWPLVHVSEKSVQVLGMSDWGVFLSSPSGKDWQLFVIKKEQPSHG